MPTTMAPLPLKKCRLSCAGTSRSASPEGQPSELMRLSRISMADDCGKNIVVARNCLA